MEYVQTEERKPTEKEDPHNQTQCLSSLAFLLQRKSFHVNLDVLGGVHSQGVLVHLKLLGMVLDCMNPSCLFLGYHEDFPIDKQHENHWDEERHNRGCNSKGEVKRGRTGLRVLLCTAVQQSSSARSVGAKGDTNGGDDQRQNPAEQQQHDHPPRRHSSRVVQGVTDCYVSFQRNAAEIKNGACTEGDIQYEVNSAEAVPKVPGVDGAHQAERHHQHRNQEISHCQGNHKGIGGCPEALDTCHRRHDEKISHDGEDGDRKKQAQYADSNNVAVNYHRIAAVSRHALIT